MVEKTLGRADVKDGSATVKYTVPSDSEIGTKTLYGKYEGTNNYKQGTGTANYTITKKTTTTVSDTLASAGETALFHAQVYYNTDDQVPEGEVQFKLDGVDIGTPQTVTNGVATLEYTLADSVENNSEITATYLGTETYGVSSTTTPGYLTLRKNINITIKSISYNKGDEATFTATLTDGEGEPVTEGLCTLFIDDVTTGISCNPSDIGVCTFNYTIPSSIDAGTHTYTIKYPKTEDYDAGTKSANLTIRKAVTLNPSNISADAGESITLLIQVLDENEQSITDGQVKYTVDGTELQNVTVDGSGYAKIEYTVESGATGTLEFSGYYVQNDNYMQATTTTNGIITIRKDVIITVTPINACTTDEISLSATVMNSQEPVNEGTLTFTVD